jgi:hypothetical protein
MNASAIVRATARLLRPADPTLGECHVKLRLAAYHGTCDQLGLRRDEEHRLRVRAGLRLQREIDARPHALHPPIPRRRALVVAGPLNRHERHPLTTD